MLLRPRLRRDGGSVTATSVWRCRRCSPPTRRERSTEARRLWQPVGRENLMIKVPAHAGRHARDSAADQRRHQRQRHAAVRAGRLRAGGARPTSPGSKRSRRRGGDPSRVASVASFFVSRIDTAIDAIVDARLETRRRTRASRRLLRSLARQGRHRQRQAGLPAVPGALQRPALAGARRAGRADAAAAVGQHRHQEPRLPRRRVRGGAHRTRHGQHDAAADARCLPRPRAAARQPGRRHRRRARHDGHAGAKSASRWRRSTDTLLADGRAALRRCVRQAAESGGEAEPGGGAGADQPPDLPAARRRWPPPSRRRSTSGASRARCAGSGRATPSLWTGNDEARWLGWLGITNGQLAHIERFVAVARRRAERGLLPRPAAGHGRLEPRVPR